MSDDIGSSVDIGPTRNGFLQLPRKLTLQQLWALAGVSIAVLAFSVRLEMRVLALETVIQADHKATLRMERTLCLICRHELDAATCTNICLGREDD